MSKDKSKSPKPDEGGGDEEGGFVSSNIIIKISHVLKSQTQRICPGYYYVNFSIFFSVSGLGRLKYIFLVKPNTKVIVSQTILRSSVISMK